MKFNHCIFKLGILLLVSPFIYGQARPHPPLKQLKREHRAEWLKIINWPADCENAFQKTYSNKDAQAFSGLEFYRVGKQERLVKITCYPGAYQPGSIYAWYDEKTNVARLLKFKGRESQDDTGKELSYSEINGLETWHAKTQVLEIFSKYRGLGDCGFWGRYQFSRSNPVLIEARERECDDSSPPKSIAPRRWPQKRF